MIKVSVEPANKLVHAVLGDMLSVHDVAEFSRLEQAAARSLGVGSGGFVLLIETVGNLVQTQDVMGAFSRIIADSPLKAARIAVVRDGVLTRMQSTRVMKERGDTAVFDNAPDARAWLLATEAPAA